MNQKPAKITVASLANASKLVDAAGRVLTWHKAKPSCKVASRFKVSWISHRSDDSRRCDDTLRPECLSAAWQASISAASEAKESIDFGNLGSDLA